jgi:hypothetical protein
MTSALESKKKRLTKAVLLAQAAAAGITLRQVRATKGGMVVIDGKLAESGPAPATWAITLHGRRIDSFLSEQRAVEKIRQLVAEAGR